ncbi:hypothetical protein QRD02_11270 [Aequorivita sp. SDUM287046]|uniref:Uncharacterized protein n=1 Tax=Aequorivita aurantiaca TaxID=3053356 RepID=A0ABT8DHT1_9FLAO|nr:hypothetical protein [Aequorivita aurantiaca]MDN3724966.1 hypothetical protein [Aequorivita aurantiaca]
MDCINFNNLDLDVIDKISNIIIAFLTLIFTIYIFVFTTRKGNAQLAKDRKTDSLKTIILEHNLKNLFSFYENILITMAPLASRKHSDFDKQELNNQLQNDLKDLRLRFTDLLLAVDGNLYENVKKCSDVLIDILTEKMFEENINLQNKSDYDNNIIGSISQSKTEIIKILYEYNS